jgi:hypothetical protein
MLNEYPAAHVLLFCPLVQVKILKAERDVYVAEIDSKLLMKIGPGDFAPDPKEYAIGRSRPPAGARTPLHSRPQSQQLVLGSAQASHDQPKQHLATWLKPP